MSMRIYLIAGEASGDLLGAGLIRSLRERLGEEVYFYGVGGEKMIAEGFESLFPYHELSIMGFLEVIPRITRILSRIDFVVDDVLTKQPDVVITIDSPGFNFRVAKKLRKVGLEKTRLIHYVAPTVWAYKPERAKKTAEIFNYLMCLLPFEPPYFEAEGLPTAFVGHPVAYRIPGNGKAFRDKYEYPEQIPMICLLPGSRENEIKRHMPLFAETISKLGVLNPSIALVIPVAERLGEMINQYLDECPFRYEIITDDAEKADAINACNVALVKSGTISLEVAANQVPQVVAYRANYITTLIARCLIKVRYANLINLMADRIVIPEFLQEYATPHALANALAALFKSEDMRRDQLQNTAKELARMRLPDAMHPSDKAAEVVVQVANDTIKVQ